MRYPQVSKQVEQERVARSLKQMRIGDIVEAWLDCEPSPGYTRPLPLIIVGLPVLHNTRHGDSFRVKTLFESETFEVRFSYQWRIVGHIDGLEELIAAEEAAQVASHIAQRSNLTQLDAREE